MFVYCMLHQNKEIIVQHVVVGYVGIWFWYWQYSKHEKIHSGLIFPFIIKNHMRKRAKYLNRYCKFQYGIGLLLVLFHHVHVLARRSFPFWWKWDDKGESIVTSLIFHVIHNGDIILIYPYATSSRELRGSRERESVGEECNLSLHW